MSTPEARQRARDRAADAISIPAGPGRRGGPSQESTPRQSLRKEPMPDLVKCEYCPRSIKPGAAMEAHVRASHPHMVGDQTSPPPSPPTNGVRWEDPPETARDRGGRIIERLRPLFPELRRNPGRWARVLDYPRKQSAWSTRTVLLKSKSWPKDIELRAHRTEGDAGALFARYVPANVEEG